MRGRSPSGDPTRRGCRTPPLAASRRASTLAAVVTVAFTFSGAETRRMLRYILLRSRGPTLMLVTGIGIVAVAIALGKPLWSAVGAAELLGWVGLLALMPGAGSRTPPSEQTMSFSEDGIAAANAGGSQRFPWSHWRRWTRVGDLYLLRGPRGVFTFIPGRAFASVDAEGEFRDLLARHVPSSGLRRGSAAA